MQVLLDFDQAVCCVFLLGSLTFTLNAAASQGFAVRMGPAGVMWGWAGIITGVICPLPVPPSQGSSGARELQGWTQLRSDIPSLGLRSCCTFRPNPNNAEWLAVSQHAQDTYCYSAVGPLRLSLLWHLRTFQFRCVIPKMLNKSLFI